MWEDVPLTLESFPDGGAPVEAETLAWLKRSESLSDLVVESVAVSSEDEASVGQWLSNIGQGAATGAATGMAAGPWGALVGGLLGGGLGAVQTAMAPQQPAASPPPAAPRPPPPRPAVRPPTQRPQAVSPPTVARPATAAGQPGTAQLLDQIAALVPVVAALAAQVGQLSQVVQAPGAVAQETSAEHWEQGDSGEAVLDGDTWATPGPGACFAAENCADPGTDT